MSETLRRAALLNVQDLFLGVVLDLGCGSTPYKPLLGQRVRRWFGLDRPMTFSGRPHADVFGTALEIPFRSDRFDVVLCTEVLEHVVSPPGLLSETHRVLKPGGVLVLTAPQTCPLHEEPHDYLRFTGHGLRLMAENAGFQVIRIDQTGGAIATVGQMVIWHLNWIRRLPLGRIIAPAVNATLAWIVLKLDRWSSPYGVGVRVDTLGWLLVARRTDG